MGQLDERDTRVFESARTRRTRTLRINSSRHPSEKHCSPSKEILAQHLALEARLIRKRYKIAVGEHRDATPVPSVSRLWIRRSARFTACWTPPGRLPRRTPTQPKHTHSLHARGHTSNRPRLAWESFRSAAASSAAAGCCAPTASLLARPRCDRVRWNRPMGVQPRRRRTWSRP